MKKRPDKNNSVDKKILLKIVNPNKLKVINILGKEKNLNQSDLQKKMNISYKETRRYINVLQQQGILKKKAVKKKRGSPVFISLKK